MTQADVSLGIIGAGASLPMYGPALRHLNGFRIAAVADSDPDRLARGVAEFEAEEGYPTAVAMLVGGRLDGVLVASPPFCHLDHVLTAARAGAHAMVEKPMARTCAEGAKMMGACAEAGVLLAVGLNRRFLPPLATATRMVQSGDLGEVFHVEAIWTSWSMPFSAGWRDDRQCLGGVFQDHGAHTVDLATQWLGPVESVFAQVHRTGPRVGCDRGVEDHVNVCYTHAGGSTSVHIQSRDSHRPVSEFYRLYGTQGTLELEYTGDWSFVARDNWEMRLFRDGHPVPQRLASRRPGNELLDELSDGEYAYFVELRAFTDAIRDGATSVSPSGEEGADVVRAICAAYLSAAEGRVVPIEDGETFDENTYRAMLEPSGRARRR